jgi:uncharacterized protein (TIGR03000 family)
MYTLVLMAAMTGGEASPQWLFNHGCGGGHHSCYASCSCYSGCGGCGGGWGHGHRGGWGCAGCGGYYGGTPFMGICAGSHWDGHPGYGAYGCMGPGYCGGGCYASGGYAQGWPGAYGSCYGYGGGWGGAGSFTCGGNYGCYGGYACYGIPTAPVDGVVVPNPNPGVSPAPVPMLSPKASLENKVRSRVVIDTPENAKLYVDGQLMQTGSTHRVFQTPELTPGATYFYDVKIEVVKNGKTETDEQRIYVRPGQETAVAFREPPVRSDIATVSTGRE